MKKIDYLESNVWVRAREVPDNPDNYITVDMNAHYECFFNAAKNSSLGVKSLETHHLKRGPEKQKNDEKY
jgi:hypothetical protein